MTYDRSYIVRKLRGLIGFMPSYDISNARAKIDDSLSVSQSGVFVNDIHPFFTPEVFSNVADRFTGFTVRPWNIAAAYPAGAVVNYQNKVYQAVEATTAGELPTTAKWSETSMLSVWFRNKYDGAVLSLIDKLVERKKLEGHGKEFRGRTPLYNAEGAASGIITKSSRFVGFEIDLKQDNMAVYVQRIGMQLTESATVPIHIIYDDEEEVYPLTFGGDSRFKYQDIEIKPFLSGSGSVVIGYYEDDLGTANAIGFSNKVFSQEPCYSCGGMDSTSRFSWDSLVSVKPFSEKNNEISYNYETNFGLNLVLSFRCDLSDLLIREKMSLVAALRSQLRLDLMQAIASNTRNNQQADSTSILIYNQLTDWDDPDNPKIALDRSVKALDFEFSGNSACYQCSKKARITNRVI